MPINYDALWDEAYKMACQRGHEEGTYEIDYKEEDIERWAEDYYYYLKDLKEVESDE